MTVNITLLGVTLREMNVNFFRIAAFVLISTGIHTATAQNALVPDSLCTDYRISCGEGFYCAAMTATDKDKTTAIRIARLKAIAQVSAQLNASLTAATERYIAARREAGAEELQEDYSTRITETVSSHVRTFETICSHASKGDGDIWRATVGVTIGPAEVERILHAVYTDNSEGEKYVKEFLSGNEE